MFLKKLVQGIHMIWLVRDTSTLKLVVEQLLSYQISSNYLAEFDPLLHFLSNPQNIWTSFPCLRFDSHEFSALHHYSHLLQLYSQLYIYAMLDHCLIIHWNLFNHYPMPSHILSGVNMLGKRTEIYASPKLTIQNIINSAPMIKVNGNLPHIRHQVSGALTRSLGRSN